MNDSQTKRILGFYDEHAEYVKNDRHSDRSQTVYTRPEDKYHWLVAKPQGKNRLEIHQTADKVSSLAPEVYSNLISSIKNRKLYERDHSITERLAKAKEQSKQSVNTEQKKDTSRRKEQSL